MLTGFFADRTGLEPATPCVTGTYSNRLNYRSVILRTTAKSDGKDTHFSEISKTFCHELCNFHI